jgi:uncharacterized protein YcfJ
MIKEPQFDPHQACRHLLYFFKTCGRAVRTVVGTAVRTAVGTVVGTAVRTAVGTVVGTAVRTAVLERKLNQHRIACSLLGHVTCSGPINSPEVL